LGQGCQGAAHELHGGPGKARYTLVRLSQRRTKRVLHHYAFSQEFFGLPAWLGVAGLGWFWLGVAEQDGVSSLYCGAA